MDQVLLISLMSFQLLIVYLLRLPAVLSAWTSVHRAATFLAIIVGLDNATFLFRNLIEFSGSGVKPAKLDFFAFITANRHVDVLSKKPSTYPCSFILATLLGVALLNCLICLCYSVFAQSTLREISANSHGRLTL